PSARRPHEASCRRAASQRVPRRHVVNCLPWPRASLRTPLPARAGRLQRTNGEGSVTSDWECEVSLVHPYLWLVQAPKLVLNAMPVSIRFLEHLQTAGCYQPNSSCPPAPAMVL